MATKNSVGFGIVGCGMIARFHALAIQAMRGAHLAAVFSRSAKNANALAKEFGCAAYTDYADFLRHDGLHAVAIATPSGAHLEPTVAAAKAGKHVVCEKPLEVTLERVDKMIAACEKYKVVLAGIFPRRFNPATIAFKKAVEQGRFGKITMADAYIKWFRTQEYYDSGAWRGTWALDGGGALMNQSIHTIDLLYYLAGEVECVSAFAGLRTHERIEVEDNAAATLRFKSGALGVIQGSTSCWSAGGHAAEVHLCGSAGSVFMKDNSFRVWEFAKKRVSDKKVLATFGEQVGAKGAGAADPKAIDFIGHQRNFEDAVKAIKNGTKPAIDGHEGRKSIEIIMGIYQSALSGGKPVTLPLKRTPRRTKFAKM